jgi:hypothetical protein
MYAIYECGDMDADEGGNAHGGAAASLASRLLFGRRG